MQFNDIVWFSSRHHRPHLTDKLLVFIPFIELTITSGRKYFLVNLCELFNSGMCQNSIITCDLFAFPIWTKSIVFVARVRFDELLTNLVAHSDFNENRVLVTCNL